MPTGVQLPRVIAIDEYKADTDSGTYQLIIANAETHEPIDILPNRRKETIYNNYYLFLDNSSFFILPLVNVYAVKKT